MNITYQLCSWGKEKERLMQVREEVFIIEQSVPVELEMDEHDEHCQHILALVGDTPIGTARLLNDGHIGRMCVLKKFRNQGIGSELLIQLINIAQQKQFQKVLLNAQITAIPFYEKSGFSVCSDTFMDAGIEHKTMELALNQALLGVNKTTIELDGKALCRETIACMIEQAYQDIAIFTQNLEFNLYHQSSIFNAITQLIRSNRKASIRIICKDTRVASQQAHCFIDLAQRFSTFIEIRKPTTKELLKFRQSWLMVDNSGYCHIKNLDRYIGIASFNQKLIVKESLDYFNHAWENSEVDQQTRRLSL